MGLAAACDFLDDWLDFQFRQTNLVGCVVAVHQADTVLFSKAFGLADTSSGQPLTTSHLFNIGSQTKMMTATAIMQLVDKDLLGLSDRIVAYLPWLELHDDTRVRGITVEQLLTHRAGLIRDGLEANFWQLEADFPTQAQLQRMTLSAQLVTQESFTYKYSNIGYALLGLLIQKVSQQPYEAFVQRHIITPLRLKHTFPAFNDHIADRIATGYTRVINGERWAAPCALDIQSFTPVAGWYATAEDLCRFMAAHFSDKATFLSRSSRDWLHAGHRSHWVSGEHRGKEYGGGFMIQRIGDQTLVGHSGSFIGHRSCSYYDPISHIGITIMANTKDAPVQLMMRGIWSIIQHFLRYGNEPCGPERHRLNVRLMNPWTTIQIIATKNHIIAARLGEWLPLLLVEELQQISPGVLRISKADDDASARELVTYHFLGNNLVSVNYAGSTLRPEQRFYSWLKNSWPV